MRCLQIKEALDTLKTYSMTAVLDSMIKNGNFWRYVYSVKEDEKFCGVSSVRKPFWNSEMARQVLPEIVSSVQMMNTRLVKEIFRL